MERIQVSSSISWLFLVIAEGSTGRRSSWVNADATRTRHESFLPGLAAAAATPAFFLVGLLSGTLRLPPRKNEGR